MKRSTKVVVSIFALCGIITALSVLVLDPRFGALVRGPYRISLHGLSDQRQGEFLFETTDGESQAVVRQAIIAGELDPHPLKWEYVGSVEDRTELVPLFAPGDNGLVYKRERQYYRSRVRLSQFLDSVERTCRLVSARHE